MIEVRESLLRWYGIVRHSVDVKIMCRFPKQVLLVKALELRDKYLQACLDRGIPPQPCEITEKWINDWLVENRLTQ